VSRLRVVIADDHPVVRAGLRGLLDGDPDFEVVGEASDGLAAVDATERLRPDIVLMDLQMPIMNGTEAIRRIRANPDAPPVLVLTTYENDGQILGAIEAGAAGYLLKDTPVETLFAAIRSTVEGGSPLAPSVAARVLRRVGRAVGDSGPLSARELEVLGRVARGRSNGEIARDLRISEATVKTHLIHIFEKLDVADRTSAVTTALQRGIIELPR
jgi:DNA-binding NarL/FixJ family response regulator